MIKPTSFKGSKPTSFKEYKPTSFHKLQRYNPTSFKDKFTSFKSSSLQAHKLQGTSFTSLHKVSKVQSPPSSGPQQQAHRLQNSSSKPTKQWPTTTSFKDLKPKF
jgi:hypothetical protein